MIRFERRLKSGCFYRVVRECSASIEIGAIYSLKGSRGTFDRVAPEIITLSQFQNAACERSFRYRTVEAPDLIDTRLATIKETRQAGHMPWYLNLRE